MKKPIALIILVNAVAALIGRAEIRFTGEVVPPSPDDWSTAAFTVVGQSGAGEVEVDGGSSLISSNVCYLGFSAGGEGEVSVSGVGSIFSVKGGTIFHPANLYVGRNGNGVIHISDGGTISCDHDSYFGFAFGTVGNASVDGAGSGFSSSRRIHVGYGGQSTLRITDGAAVSTEGAVRIASSGGSEGEVVVTGAGSSMTAYNVWVGFGGEGTLQISSNGTVDALYAFIGHGTPMSEASVAGSGSSLTLDYDLMAGSEGNGTLDVSGGGTVNAGRDIFIGYESTSTGIVSVSGTGSDLSTVEDLRVGRDGNGTLRISDGGEGSSDDCIYIGDNPDSEGEVFVEGAGSTLLASYLYVGYEGRGRLYITNGGLVRVDSRLTIDWDYTMSSYVKMDSGGMLAIASDHETETLSEFRRLFSYGEIQYFDGTDWVVLTNFTPEEYYTLEYDGTYNILTIGSTSEPPGTEPVDVGTIWIDCLAGNQVAVSWNSSNAANYSVESTTNLVSGIWQNVATNIIGVDGTMSVTGPVDRAVNFYRVKSH